MKAFKSIIFITLVLIFISCKEKQQGATLETSIEILDYSGELSSGIIKRIDSFPSKYVRPRTVDVWLPENYSDKQKYAVLYMHDGQMLFDAETTWNKQEWKVDEIVGGLISEGKIKNTIVVAIWNHSDIRHSDYYPQKPFNLLPQKFRDSIFSEGQKQFGTSFKELQSDNYLKFIVEEVKPFIDSTFSVYKNPENTFITGSSMGGLISMYALCEYPKIFGGAACLSTHWPGFMPQENSIVPETFFKYLEKSLPASKRHKIYFDYGTETLDKFYLPYQHRVDEILKKKGYDKTKARNLKFEGHDHSENSWNQRFQIPVEFLLKK
ncbi:alpha/beta hydrolase [Lutibacter flavus]|uniref:Predicted hydrolase of the alpha/beta superfamily n=1 Tax=Lutibacter flavus TaxID=691689 RepID=A0A238XUH3_9FLAO|nr:alpha/beta hydrolase-fold protein [Lutibacter flavus]SNR62716.1 Predicted hydrolase of the alpha/beta superfamily [Lutibacter flavus]